MKKQVKKRIAQILTGCMILGMCNLTSVSAKAETINGENDHLYHIRTEQAKEYINSEDGNQEEGTGGERISTPVSAGAPSVCAGSACVGSICLGSACAGSVCIISGCIGSTCALCP